MRTRGVGRSPIVVGSAFLVGTEYEERAMKDHRSDNQKYAKLFITAARDDGLAIIGYAPELLKKTGELRIPSELNGKRVVEVQDQALAELRFSSVFIPESVIKLGPSPFRRCVFLKSVEVAPENPFFASVDGVLFDKNLTELIYYPIMKKDADYRVPDGVLRLRGNSFRQVAYLERAYLPPSVENVNNTFLYCDKLAEIQVAPENQFYSSHDGVLLSKDGTLLVRFCLDRKGVAEYLVPERVKRFDTDAFEGSRGVKRIVLSKSFEEFGLLFHSSLPSLTEIDVDPDNPRFSAVDGALFSKDGATLILCPNTTEKSEYVLPDHVREVDPTAFDLASNIQGIFVSPENPCFSSVDGVLLTKDGTELARYPRGKEWENYVTPAKVHTICDHAFNSCETLRRVVLSEDVRRVGDYAFGACSNLENIDFLGDLEYIGPRAFSFCFSLRKIAIPEGVKSVLQSTFEHAGLARVELPDSLESIDDAAFRGCACLSEITLGKKVKSIAITAFAGCPATLFVHKGSVAHSILRQTNRIFPGLFARQFKLIDEASPQKSKSKSFSHAPSNPRLFKTQPVGENELAIAGLVQRFFPLDGVIVVPAEIDGRRVVEILDRAFTQTMCVKIVFPASVRKIGVHAFLSTDWLESIEVDPANEDFASLDGVLFNKDFTELAHYPANKADVDYRIPSSVKIVRDTALTCCRRLRGICVPGGLEYYDSQFWGYSTLVAINASGDNESYFSRDGILYDKTGAMLALYPKSKPQKRFVLPKNVEFVPMISFDGIYQLEEIDVEPGSQYFSAYEGTLFDRYETKLVRFPAGRKATKYVVPENVQTIGEFAFFGASSLTTIELPEGLERIEASAFLNCPNLRKLVVPDGVRTIEAATFARSDSLRSVELPASLESIDRAAFLGCGALTSIVVPDGVKSIGERAFFMCSALKTVVLPPSVESIADDAFDASDPTLRVFEGSYAHRWAIEHGKKFD